ncbi:MAG: hypothetical protein EXX96DRAFT_541518 [Benjaminiella poitrasii]|nr:MAG: hypothetical protein EXX96DRAFT_541518 [Benjaminiella poitrasii]
MNTVCFSSRQAFYLFSIALGIKTSYYLTTIMTMNSVAIARQYTTKQVKYHSIEAVSISEITLLPEHIAITPFQKLIANNYVEMNDELSVILNTDWSRYPWLRYVCARMMEGALFLDHGKGLSCTFDLM